MNSHNTVTRLHHYQPRFANVALSASLKMEYRRQEAHALNETTVGVPLVTPFRLLPFSRRHSVGYLFVIQIPSSKNESTEQFIRTAKHCQWVPTNSTKASCTEVMSLYSSYSNMESSKLAPPRMHGDAETCGFIMFIWLHSQFMVVAVIFYSMLGLL